MYSKEELLEGLHTKVIGHRVFVFDEIDSTNTCAKMLADTGLEDGTIVISDYQTAGRGRFGRLWVAEPKSNLLFSIILKPHIIKTQIGLLPLFVAASVALALETIIDKKIECRWPNDLLLSGKKVSGILVESLSTQESLNYAIVGIGVNVNQSFFGHELNDKATSLWNETGISHDRRSIFRRILEELDALYIEVHKSDFTRALQEWNSRAHMFGHNVTLAQGEHTFTGVAHRITDDGGLVLETSSGLRTFYAGDVTLNRT